MTGFATTKLGSHVGVNCLRDRHMDLALALALVCSPAPIVNCAWVIRKCDFWLRSACALRDTRFGVPYVISTALRQKWQMRAIRLCGGGS
jgi:hypothetical protein